MARQVVGTQGILESSRRICRLVNRFGVARLAVQTTPAFAAAVEALAVACHILDLVDDYVSVVDRTSGGTGANDEDLPVGAGTLANEAEDNGVG